MIRAIVRSSLRFRLLVVGIAAAVLAVGVTQLRDAPVDVLPEFTPPYVEIQTEALGLSAQELRRRASRGGPVGTWRRSRGSAIAAPTSARPCSRTRYTASTSARTGSASARTSTTTTRSPPSTGRSRDIQGFTATDRHI